MIPSSPDDKQMINDPDSWPRWPFLPLKKKGRTPSIQGKTSGCLLHTEEFSSGVRIVYHANVWKWPEGDAVKEIPTTTYESTDALLADGWVID